MNRRNFLRWMAAGGTPLALSLLCNLPLDIFNSSPTPGPIASPPKGLPPKIASPAGATPTTGPVPAPSGGLGSNSNYHLHAGCNPVTGLSVTIDITKDIVSDIGFGFQLNGYSRQGANCVWQQYFFALGTTNHSPLAVRAWIDNWPSESFRQSLNLPHGSDLINHAELMLKLPGSILPAGYKFTINLKYDKNDNVNGAAFIIADKDGKTLRKEMMLESLTYDSPTGTGKPVTSDALAPIYAFELDVVGPINGEHAVLSSGAGMITYTASSPLYVANKDPKCTAARTTFTTEQANTSYAPLLPGPSRTITQSFDTRAP